MKHNKSIHWTLDIFIQKNKKVNVSVVPNIKVIDPTGAGDSFAGGVIGYIAANGLNNLEEAV